MGENTNCILTYHTYGTQEKPLPLPSVPVLFSLQVETGFSYPFHAMERVEQQFHVFPHITQITTNHRKHYFWHFTRSMLYNAALSDGPALKIVYKVQGLSVGLLHTRTNIGTQI